MAFNKQQKDERRKELNLPIYNGKDFHILEDELEKYTIERNLTIAGETRMVKYVPKDGLTQWYADNGATTEDFSIKDIPKFKLLQDKLNQYYDWLRRKEYAIKMQAEQFDEMVGVVNTDLPF